MAVGRINKTAVDALKAGETLFDTELKGFMVRARSGAKVYALKYLAQGRQRIMTLGEHGVLTPDQARRLALQAKATATRGNDPQQRRDEEKARSEAATFAKLADLYDVRHISRAQKARTAAENRRLIARSLVPLFGGRPLTGVTKLDVLRLKDRYADRPVAFNRLRALLHHMFEKAREWDLHPGPNPAADVPKNKERHRKTRLTDDQYRQLFKALDDATTTEHPSVILCIKLLALTGARLSEILTLTWRDVDLDKNALRLPDSKTGEKVIALGEPAAALLAAQKAVGPYVCHGRFADQPLAPPQRQWRRIRAKAGLDWLHIHDLRHAFASKAIDIGESVKLIGTGLGHSNTQMTDRYVTVAHSPAVGAVDRTARSIADLAIPVAGIAASNDNAPCSDESCPPIEVK